MKPRKPLIVTTSVVDEHGNKLDVDPMDVPELANEAAAALLSYQTGILHRVKKSTLNGECS